MVHEMSTSDEHRVREKEINKKIENIGEVERKGETFFD